MDKVDDPYDDVGRDQMLSSPDLVHCLGHLYAVLELRSNSILFGLAGDLSAVLLVHLLGTSDFDIAASSSLCHYRHLIGSRVNVGDPEPHGEYEV